MKTKVFIGVPTSENGRAAVFYDYVNNLHKPEGTIGAGFHTPSGAMNRNLIIEEALRTQCTHILFIDDDMAFPPDALLKLLRHEVNVVSGLYFNRCYPHNPVLFDYNQDNRFTRHFLNDDEHGLIECEAVGFGFLLVNTKIFESLAKPYVRMGEIRSDERNEDIGFCLRCRQASIPVHCDLDLPIGHIGQATFWPSFSNGIWYTAIDTNGDQIAYIPQITNPDIPSNKLGPIEEVPGY